MYKGGPKNYSKRDWQILGLMLAVFTVFWFAFGFGNNGPIGANSSSIRASSEARAAAERAGYQGKEAEEVGVAADRLCAATGEC